MNHIGMLQEMINESNQIVFLVVLVCLQKAIYQIFEVRMDYTKNLINIRRNKL